MTPRQLSHELLKLTLLMVLWGNCCSQLPQLHHKPMTTSSPSLSAATSREKIGEINQEAALETDLDNLPIDEAFSHSDRYLRMEVTLEHRINGTLFHFDSIFLIQVCVLHTHFPQKNSETFHYETSIVSELIKN